MTRSFLRRRSSMALLAGFALAGVAVADPGSAFRDLAAAEAAAFAEADANGDGKLTWEEFADYGTLLRQKLDALRFARLDTDGDGAVTEEELNMGRPAGGLPPPPF